MRESKALGTSSSWTCMAQGTSSTGEHVEHEDCRYGTRASMTRNLAHSKMIRLPIVKKFLLFLICDFNYTLNYNYHKCLHKGFCDLYNLKILMKETICLKMMKIRHVFTLR